MFKKALCIGLALVAAQGMAQDRDSVTMGGKQVMLSGTLPQVGETAPGFRVVDASFKPVALSDFKGKTVLISAVPSLDTGVCALQTKRFNDEVGKFDGKSVVMLTLSTDLPFAQKRFCKTEGVENIQVLSDSVWRNFAEEYGLLIEDRGLLARSIFIVDAEGTLRYKELVGEVSHHPDYDAALAALKDISQQ
ncbi:thiol peroxidase [Shewanella amazonensis]|uniref:Thiol peroxidase (Atypical 2-Cys peroxiredoxin) n=1 Tax=Shewanella amazonensis (strain ATCC BAA-1098 / SB2B) TaxID=326297 RepID=A1S8G2_SHEAM|nr:thiol peroxidase [Shewanella amazonensis]ABM00669.1 thiol peroxidase (atypical 2-Cys peroxiredoxin) [Shewanella amazonensis SB2B]